MVAAATSPAVLFVTVVLGLTSLALWIETLIAARGGVHPLAERPAPPAPWHPLAVLALFLLAMILMPALLARWLQVPAEPSLQRIQCYVLAGLVVLPLVPLLLWTPGLGPLDFGLHQGGWEADMRAGLWGFLLALVPVYLAELPVSGWREPHPLLQVLGRNPSWEIVAWITLSAVVVAPLFEELLFRVVLQGLLVHRNPLLGIVCTALLFSMVHSWPDPVPLFPLALILGYVYHRRHSYLAVVTTHALFNGLNLGLALASPDQAG